MRFITRLPLTDATSGFKCWRREVLEAIDLDRIFSSGYLFQVEMSYQTYQKKFRIAEVPIIFVERRLGRSKMDWAIIAEGYPRSHSACVCGVDGKACGPALAVQAVLPREVAWKTHQKWRASNC